MRRNRKFNLGFFRNRLLFFRTVSVSGPNGSTYEYEHAYTDLFQKDTQLQGSTYAETGGANITNQDCIFYGRSNSTFFPEKGMICFNQVDGFWYNILSPQPLEDPARFYRFIGQRKESSFAPEFESNLQSELQAAL